MKEFRGIGLMSGTSLDGVDLAYCAFSEKDDRFWTYEILETATLSYPTEWRRRLENLQNESAERYARTHVEYGHYLGELTKQFIATRHVEPDFVASHGHTIFHQPETGFTAQIGDGETMAAHLPCPLVTNFRNKDVALKGQGAPLVPFGEKSLFPDCRLFLNLGGFSNISAGAIAFDVSPCNFALNWAVRRHDRTLEFDEDGRIARSGECNQRLLAKLDSLDYYQQSPPKSLGREWFEQHFLPLLVDETTLSPADLLCTLCHHIASQAGRAVAATGIRNAEIIVTGGGFKNSFLAKLLEKQFEESGIRFHPKLDAKTVDYKEALIFAFLGLNVLLGRPNILPSVTGATNSSVSGSIHLPVAPGKTALFTSE